MVKVFFSYSHRDESVRDELETHLAMLKRQGIISAWHDRRIGAGHDVDRTISAELESADIILLLVSPYFLASDYCYDIEMKRAVERHEAGEAVVIPVIADPCDWHSTPFGRLRATPKDGKPISKFPNIHDALLEVTQEVRAAANLLGKGSGTPETEAPPLNVTTSGENPRSSNLRVKKTFSEHERDLFVDETVSYIAAYFDNSLEELKKRNTQIDVRFRRHGDSAFSAAVYLNGEKRTACRIWAAGRNAFGGDIAYSSDEAAQGNSFNESMSVKDDGYTLGFAPLGLAFLGQRTEEILSREGAAEYFWTMFVRPLQQ